jgi:hypothetical protein
MSTDRNDPTRSPVAIVLAVNEDIWDLVASELEDNPAALCAGALVSSVLLAPMQRTLFRTVYLDADRLGPLSVSLLSNPALGAYIRALIVRSASVLHCLLVNLDGGRAPNALASVRWLRVGYGRWQAEEVHLPMLAAQFASLAVLELVRTFFLDAPSVQRLLGCFTSLHTLHWHHSHIQISHIEPGALALPPLRDFYWDEKTRGWEYDTYERAGAWARAGTWTYLERFAIRACAAPQVWPALASASTTLRHLCLTEIRSETTLDAVSELGMYHCWVAARAICLPNRSGRRSNASFARLETLVLDIGWGITMDILHAVGRFLDSLVSPHLHNLTLVADQDESDRDHVWDLSMDWAPLINSVVDLHRKLSPELRKSLNVLLLGCERHEDYVRSIRDALSCLRGVADVDVRGVFRSRLASTVAGPVPGFPLLISHRTALSAGH